MEKNDELKKMVAMIQNWKIYRSIVNQRECIFSVNLAIAEVFENTSFSSVVQFSLPYKVDDSNPDGIPNIAQTEVLIDDMTKIITQLNALPDTLYSGHVIGNGKNEIYFYTNHANELIDILKGFDDIVDIKQQEDPQASVYFDFLMPSSLELKLNTTDEILTVLHTSGDDLSIPRPVEHIFHFKNEENLQRFIDNFNTNFFDFFELQQGIEEIEEENNTVKNKEKVYVATLTNEMTLDDRDIFNFVEQFNILAERFDGEYIGWMSNEVEANQQVLALH